MLTDDTITDDQIRLLSTEAAQHGDHAMVLICELATGDVVLDEDTAIESLPIAELISREDLQRIAAMHPTDCRAECARVIANAAAQVDTSESG